MSSLPLRISSRLRLAAVLLATVGLSACALRIGEAIPAMGGVPILRAQSPAPEAGSVPFPGGGIVVPTTEASAPVDAPSPESPSDAIAAGAVGPTQLRIVSLTTPIRPGVDAALTAATDPGVECQIGVYYRNGRSSAPGLAPKAADAAGLVSWRWRVEESAEIDRDESSVLVLCSVGRDLLSRGAPLVPAG